MIFLLKLLTIIKLFKSVASIDLILKVA
jgi:hypothetical protein